MTAKRGVPGPDGLDFGQAGLDGLVRALTAAPSPAELAGEQEALAAFRAVRAEQATPADPAARAWQGIRVPVPSADVPTTAVRSVPGPSAPRQAASWLAPGVRRRRPRRPPCGCAPGWPRRPWLFSRRRSAPPMRKPCLRRSSGPPITCSASPGCQDPARTRAARPDQGRARAQLRRPGLATPAPPAGRLRPAAGQVTAGLARASRCLAGRSTAGRGSRRRLPSR